MARHGRALEAVLLDFGGVIAEEGFREGLRYLAEVQGLDPDAVEALGPDAMHDSGYISGDGTEADFWALMRARGGLAGPDDALTEVILRRFVLRPWMLAYVEKLRASGLVVAILSDQTDWLERLDEEEHFSRCFDRVFNSYRLGRSKRDPGMFDEVVAELNVAPAAALFIDDTPGHVERARARGLAGIVYRGRRELSERLRAWPELPVLAPPDAGEAVSGRS